jgi:hypothetical protein
MFQTLIVILWPYLHGIVALSIYMAIAKIGVYARIPTIPIRPDIWTYVEEFILIQLVLIINCVILI